jgi:hypothetical protein
VALDVKVGTIAAKTSTGVQAYTGVGFTPKAIMFWATSQTAAGYAAVASIMFGCATASSYQWAVAAYADDNAATVNTGGYMATDSCIRILASGAPTMDAAASFTSFDGDGFTLNWSDAAPSAFIIHYLALGGTDITNAKAGSFTSRSGAGAQSVTDPGFTPTFLLGSSNQNTAVGNRNSSTVGLYMASGVSNQRGLGYQSADAGADTVAASSQRNSQWMVEPSSGGTYNWLADLTGFTATGFDLNFTNSAGARLKLYLALSGTFKVYVGAGLQKTSTGTEATTGVGFTPNALLFGSWGQAASASVDTSSADNTKVSIGAATATAEGFVWNNDVDGAATSVANMRTVTDKAIGFSTATSTTDAEADLSSLDSDGFTLDWTTADAVAREFIFTAFGSSSDTLGWPAVDSLGGPYKQRAPMPMIVGPREDRIMSMQGRQKG